jgi:hypothetical protein
MNASVSHLLKALSLLGAERVRFQILQNGSVQRHTVPVALAAGWSRTGLKLPALSLHELFAAFALVPHQGEYILQVDSGQLTYLPPLPRQPARTVKKPASRLRLKKSLRRRHRTPAHAPHKLAA